MCMARSFGRWCACCSAHISVAGISVAGISVAGISVAGFSFVGSVLVASALLSGCGSGDDRASDAASRTEDSSLPTGSTDPSTDPSTDGGAAEDGGFDDADAGVVVQLDARALFLGNSQITHCDGSLAPLEMFSQDAGSTIDAELQRGSASFENHTVRIQDGEFDYVAFTNQQAAWEESGYEANRTDAMALHDEVLRRGARTILWMTYLIGGPAPDEAQQTFVAYWKDLETDLVAAHPEGNPGDVLLIPVLELWERGKRAYPSVRSEENCSFERGFMQDALHGARIAQYATAVLVHTFITCIDPREVSSESGFPAEFEAWAKDAAWNLFEEYRPAHCFAQQ